MSEQPERTSPPPPLPVRVIGKALTRMVARAPWTWPLMRLLVRGFFDRSADGWDERMRPEHLVALAAAVARLDAPPARALDLGTGTGAGALWLAQEFPGARVTDLDISEAMIEQAKAKLPNELSGRVEFLVGDAQRLPFPDGSLDLVAQISVPLFFDEVARVLVPGGYVVVVSSLGLKTPFHTPERTLRKGFRRRGIETVATGAEGPGTFFLARRPARSEEQATGPACCRERSDARERRPEVGTGVRARTLSQRGEGRRSRSEIRAGPIGLGGKAVLSRPRFRIPTAAGESMVHAEAFEKDEAEQSARARPMLLLAPANAAARP
jgi:SAM-dependent methyltransferase